MQIIERKQYLIDIHRKIVFRLIKELGINKLNSTLHFANIIKYYC